MTIHKAITKAARARDVEKVRDLMMIHMTEAPRYVKQMKGKLRGRLILDSEIRKRARAASAQANPRSKEKVDGG